MHDLLAFLISQSNIEDILQTFIYLTTAMLLVCMQPPLSKEIRFHYAVLQLGCY